MSKLEILSVFTNFRVRNIDTRIENYSDSQCSWTSKSVIPYFFFHIYLPTLELKIFVVKYLLTSKSEILSANH